MYETELHSVVNWLGFDVCHVPHFLRNSLSDSHFEVGLEIRHKDSKKDPLSLPTALSFYENYRKSMWRAQAKWDAEDCYDNWCAVFPWTNKHLHHKFYCSYMLAVYSQSSGKEVGMFRLWKQVLILTEGENRTVVSSLVKWEC